MIAAIYLQLVQSYSFRVAIIGVLALIGLAVIWHTRRHIEGWTLSPAWAWASLMFIGVTLAEFAIVRLTLDYGEPPIWSGALRFAVACLSFCPPMAILGARRPQHQAWGFIVLSLWVILALPALETALLQPDQPLEIHDARSWFLILLIAIGCINHLPTRFGVSAVLFGLGQVALFSPHLPMWGDFLLVRTQLSESDLGTLCVTAGMFLIVIAALLALVLSLKKRNRTGQIDHLDLLWLTYRDGYGAVWSLRVMERMHAIDSLDATLGWRGFQPSPAEWSTETRAAVATSFRGLLRKFTPKETAIE